MQTLLLMLQGQGLPLQEFVPNGNGPEDLRAKLQTDSNKVSSLEQQIQVCLESLEMHHMIDR